MNIEEEIATINQTFRQLEAENANNPNFMLQMDNLEREWISLQSSLTVGLSMKLEQYQFLVGVRSKNSLVSAISNLKDEIRKFELKSSAFFKR